MNDEYDDRFDDEDYDYDDCDDEREPIDSCDNCGCDVYADEVCYLDGLPLCDQCAWYATGGDVTQLDT